MNDRPTKKAARRTKYETLVRFRYLAVIVLSVLLTIALFTCGNIAVMSASGRSVTYARCFFAACCAVPVVILIVNIISAKRFLNGFRRKKAEEMQRYVLSHRESAEKISEEKPAYITRLRKCADICAAVIFLCGAGAAFSSGMLFRSNIKVLLVFIGAFLIFTAVSRLRTSPPELIFEDDETYIKAKDYPNLYALAAKAAKTVGCPGEIRITFTSDCNAGIGRVGKIYSVRLGIYLLCILSEEEMYNILLHEFAHMKISTYASRKDEKFAAWMSDTDNPNYAAYFPSLFFIYTDNLYGFHYILYQYASSIRSETFADGAMLRYGNAKAAASALIKVHYYDYFLWEHGVKDEPCIYEREEPDKNRLEKEFLSFKNAIRDNKEMWDGLTDAEILSRNASHPTLKMRLDHMGINDRYIYDENISREEYRTECRRILAHLDSTLYGDVSQTYEDARKSHYIEPKRRVDAWKEAGEPVIADEYADIIIALRKLGRNREAYGLACRAAESLPPSGASYANFIKGCCLLHSYDASGIDCVYAAMKENSNYIDEGLETIGEFCCITGRQSDLDVYRERAIALAQESMDKFSHLSELKKSDALSSESLPEGMLEGLLEYINGIDDVKCLNNIYLVRKTISDDFFTSVLVLDFVKNTDYDVMNRVYEKIFNHLDTFSSRQFSLFISNEVPRGAINKMKRIEGSRVFTRCA